MTSINPSFEHVVPGSVLDLAARWRNMLPKVVTRGGIPLCDCSSATAKKKNNSHVDRHIRLVSLLSGKEKRASLTWQLARGWPLRQSAPVSVACQWTEPIRSNSMLEFEVPLVKSLEFKMKVLSTLGSGEWQTAMQDGSFS